MADKDAWREMAKERASLEEIVFAFDEYQQTQASIDGCRAMLNEHLESEMKELVHEEIAGLERKLEGLEERLHILLLPKDPNDEQDVILEIRAGTGGDEASLFGAVFCACTCATRNATDIRWNTFPAT
jgi:peptide chain release factor 1